MIIKVQPDRQKAKSLREMALVTFERLKETDKEKYPSNSLTDYYDIIRKLMEAITSIDGIKIKGEGAHQTIIDYVCDQYKLSTAAKRFIQELRDYRNKISYEGFSIKASYIKTNAKRIEEIVAVLQKLVDTKLPK